MCPALFTVGLLKKFLRLKYELKPPHKVIQTTILCICVHYALKHGTKMGIYGIYQYFLDKKPCFPL
jgi:hypothetical protein